MKEKIIKKLNLAKSYEKNNKVNQADLTYRNLINKFPKIYEVNMHYGIFLLNQKKIERSIVFFKKTIELNPNYFSFYNLAFAQMENKDYNSAILNFSKAIEYKTGDFSANLNLSNCYVEINKIDIAIKILEELKSIYQSNDIIFYNLGKCFSKLNQFKLALNSYEQSLKINHKNINAMFNKSTLLLRMGNYQEGFKTYKSRFVITPVKFKLKGQDLENIDNIKNKTILVFGEQGLGDQIQFIRFLILLAKSDCKIYFKTNSKIITIFRDNALFKDINFIEDSPNDYDFQIALMDLPKFFCKSINDVPNFKEYLFPKKIYIEQWSRKIKNNKFNIGINWKGNKASNLDKFRSFKIENFEKIFSNNFNFVNLNYEIDHNEKQFMSKYNISNFMDDCDKDEAFCDTNGIIKNLDLIITADTVTAHLAGAMNCNTWLVLKNSHHWVWTNEGIHSPWYNKMKIFREYNYENHDLLFEDVQKKLNNFFSLNNF